MVASPRKMKKPAPSVMVVRKMLEAWAGRVPGPEDEGVGTAGHRAQHHVAQQRTSHDHTHQRGCL